MLYEKEIAFMMINANYHGITMSLAHHIEHGLNSCGFPSNEDILNTSKQDDAFPFGIDHRHYKGHKLYKKYYEEGGKFTSFNDCVINVRRHKNILNETDFYKLQNAFTFLESEMKRRGLEHFDKSTYELTTAIKEFEKVSGYIYHPDEPGYTFIGDDSSRHSITFLGNEIHTSKNDICLSNEFRKSVGGHYSKRSEGTYLIYTKGLKPMLKLQEAIVEYYESKGRK